MAIVGVLVVLALDAWPAIRRHFTKPQRWIAAPVVGGQPVGFGPPPRAYRVTYRVETGTPFGSVVRTEVLEVNRPWQSRLTTRRGAPSGKRAIDTQVGDFAKFDVRSTTQIESVLIVQPDLAPLDLRLDVDRRALARAGAIVERERREVLRRRCQVYRTATRLQGQLERLDPKSDDIVDTCVDRDGLVLEQLELYKNHLVLRRRAVRVDTTPTFAPDAFAITATPTVPTSLGGGLLSTADPSTTTAPPGVDYYLPAVPDGFVLQGRYAVAPTQPTGENRPQTNRRAAFVDVWTRGVDVLLLDQGGMTYGGDALGKLPLASTLRDAGPFDGAQASPGARMSQVAVKLPGSRYVRVAGTLPVSQLADLLRNLRPVERPTQ